MNASPSLPPKKDDDDDISNYKKHSAEEIERKYGLKKGQYHHEIKKRFWLI